MKTIYFNKNFSVTSAQIEAVNLEGRFATLASHSDPENTMMLAANRTLQEPRGLLGDAYVDWLLGTVQRERPDVFIVGKEAGAVAARRAEFGALGVQALTVADAPTLRHLDRKDEFLRGWDTNLRGMQLAIAFAPTPSVSRSNRPKMVCRRGSGFRTIRPVTSSSAARYKPETEPTQLAAIRIGRPSATR